MDASAELLTIKEAAKRLKMSQAELRRLLRVKKAPAIQINPSQWRIFGQRCERKEGSAGHEACAEGVTAMSKCPLCGSPAEITDVPIESRDVECPECKKF